MTGKQDLVDTVAVGAVLARLQEVCPPGLDRARYHYPNDGANTIEFGIWRLFQIERWEEESPYSEDPDPIACLASDIWYYVAMILHREAQGYMRRRWKSVAALIEEWDLAIQVQETIDLAAHLMELTQSAMDQWSKGRGSM